MSAPSQAGRGSPRASQGWAWGVPAGGLTPNQEAASSLRRGAGGAARRRLGMAGELYPSAKPKLSGPRAAAKAARKTRRPRGTLRG